MESILVIRLSAIGDVVMASPLIAALRRAYPDAHLAWLVQPEAAALLAANEQLDEVLIWPRGEWRRVWRAGRLVELLKRVLGLRRELRRHRFSIAIDAQGLLKSGLLAWLSGAPRRIGLGSREGSGWLMTERIERGGEPGRIGSEYLHLARQLGLPTDGFPMRVALTKQDHRAAAEIAGAGDGRPYAVICPFTTRPQKHWVEGRWPELASRLSTEMGLRTLMLGGPGDRAAAERIAKNAPPGLIDAVGRTDLRQAGALIARARLLIGVDTGLGHMGIALATPSVLLFGSTLPYHNTTRTDAIVLYHRLPCSPCRRRPTCGGAFTCMHNITVNEILATARQALAARVAPL